MKKSPSNTHPERCLLRESTKIKMVIYLKRPVELGMRRISTTPREDETVTGFYGRMMT